MLVLFDSHYSHLWFQTQEMFSRINSQPDLVYLQWVVTCSLALGENVNRTRPTRKSWSGRQVRFSFDPEAGLWRQEKSVAFKVAQIQTTNTPAHGHILPFRGTKLLLCLETLSIYPRESGQAKRTRRDPSVAHLCAVIPRYTLTNQARSFKQASHSLGRSICRTGCTSNERAPQESTRALLFNRRP